MRLNKFLANAGIASRRESDRLIQAATTTVNGVVITDPAFNVEEQDIVLYDGQLLKLPQESIVIMLNKPLNYITTADDPQGRRTVFDLIRYPQRLFPIGRLDKDTTGLLLLTNNGDLAHRLLHPRNRVPRVYLAEIEGRLDDKSVNRIQKGIFIGDNEFGRAEVLKQVTEKKRTWVTLQLRQGKKREIRRIFHFLDVRLFSLHRQSYGSIELGNLPLGQWRRLTETEQNQLLKPHK